MHGGLVESTTRQSCENCYTLLGVRADGVASIVDLVAAEDLLTARQQAQALLREHLSCNLVEVWRDGALVEQLTREAWADDAPPKGELSAKLTEGAEDRGLRG
jgi:hypothetical protein